MNHKIAVLTSLLDSFCMKGTILFVLLVLLTGCKSGEPAIIARTDDPPSSVALEQSQEPKQDTFPEIMRPYHDDGINKIYNLLFCDEPYLYEYFGETPSDYPWSEIFPGDKGGNMIPVSENALKKIIEDPQLESRPKILAANILRNAGKPVPSKRILGLIVEVAMDEGLDTLAVYEDGTARYINYSEKLIVWDAKTESSDKLAETLFRSASNVVKKTGPWEGKRPPAAL